MELAWLRLGSRFVDETRRDSPSLMWGWGDPVSDECHLFNIEITKTGDNKSTTPQTSPKCWKYVTAISK